MTTGVLGTAARQDPRQVSNTLKKTVNFNDAATGVTAVVRGLGRSLTAAADVLPYVTWNATGSPSAGQAIVVIEFEGGWSS